MTSFSADPPGSPLPPAPDPGPPLGRKITRRSWQLVQETVEQAAGAFLANAQEVIAGEVRRARWHWRLEFMNQPLGAHFGD